MDALLGGMNKQLVYEMSRYTVNHNGYDRGKELVFNKSGGLLTFYNM